MAKFAYFDNTVTSPYPVIGWFDTGEFNYPNLPHVASLLEVTDAQWTGRLVDPNGWAVSGGRLITRLD